MESAPKLILARIKSQEYQGNFHKGPIHLQASSEAEADSTGLGTGLVFQPPGQFIGLVFQAESQADSEASSEADSLEADSLDLY